MKKKILLICPTLWDRRELIRDEMKSQYTIIYHEYDFRTLEKALTHNTHVKTDVKKMVDELIALCKKNAIHGVISSNDYPGTSLASIVAQKSGLIGLDPALSIQLQHKYYARLLQKKHVPEAVPQFYLAHKYDSNATTIPLSFPVFVKPIKSRFSIGARPAHTMNELQDVINKAHLPYSFLLPFNYLIENYGNVEISADYVLVEKMLEGMQVTLEGFVWNGQIHLIGITDSIMHPNRISFKRFEYPSSLPADIQERMNEIAYCFIKGIGYNNAFFNIEFMYNPSTDKIHFIEINPRMANQFADLYEKVDGTNSYLMNLALVCGEEPVYERKKGKYAIAASFPLRMFENKRVIRVPSPEEIDDIYTQFPDIRIDTWFKENQLLSDDSQDDYSYLYALIHLGAQKKKELFKKFEEAKNMLRFEFSPLNA